MSISINRNHSFSTIVIFAGLAFLGSVSIPFQRITNEHSKNTDVIRIDFTNPDMLPGVFELEVVSRIEGLIMTRDFAGSSESLTGPASASLIITLKERVDRKMALFYTRQILRNTRSLLPAGCPIPEARLETYPGSGNLPLMSFAVIGKAGLPGIGVSDRLRIELLGLEGVDEVRMTGLDEGVLHLLIGEDKCRSVGVTQSQVLHSMIKSANVGYLLPAMSGEPLFQIAGQGNTYPDRILSIQVETVSGNIPLRDVLQCSASEERPSGIAFRYNGQRAVRMDIFQQAGSNGLSVAAAVKRKMAKAMKDHNDELDIILTNDRSGMLGDEIMRQLKRLGLTMALFFLLILMVYRKPAFALTVLTGLVVTSLISFLLFLVIPVGLHLFSLAGITIAFNLVLDNSLMMADHNRINLNRKIILPMLASGLSTIAAVSLIFFMPEGWAGLSGDLAWIVIINLLVSFFTALFLIPAMQDKFRGTLPDQHIAIRRFPNRYLNAFFRFASRNKMLVIILMILYTGLPVHRLPGKAGDQWIIAPLYNNLAGKELIAEKIGPTAEKLLGGVLRLFDRFVEKRQIMENKNDGIVNVKLNCLEGSPQETLKRRTAELEALTAHHDGFMHVLTEMHSTEARLIFRLKSRHRSYLLVDLIEKHLRHSGDLTWSISGSGYYNSNYEEESLSLDYLLEFRGYEPKGINATVNAFITDLSANPRIAGLVELTPGNRINSSELPAPVINIQAEMYQTLANGIIWPFKHVMDLPQAHYCEKLIVEFNPSATHLVRLLTGKGSVIQETTVKSDSFFTTQSQSVYRKNQEYIRRFGFSYLGPTEVGRKLVSDRVESTNLQLKPGYKVMMSNPGNAGEVPWRTVILIVVLAYFVYTVASVLFGSPWQALVIILLIPVAISSVLLTFYITGLPFNEGGMAAFIIISGLAVNSSLYIIHSYKTHIENKLPYTRYEVFTLAFSEKIRPSAVTMIATVAGFLPFLVLRDTPELWLSLAAGITGGMLITFPFLFLITPLAVRTKDSAR